MNILPFPVSTISVSGLQKVAGAIEMKKNCSKAFRDNKGYSSLPSLGLWIATATFLTKTIQDDLCKRYKSSRSNRDEEELQ